MEKKIMTKPENAKAFKEWIKDRGGLAVWHSVDLSDLGWSCVTPALSKDGSPTQKPHWKASSSPARIVTDVEDVLVISPKEVKRFHVAIRMGASGVRVKCTDASSRRIRKACMKAGENSWHEFDYLTQEAVIFVPGEEVPLKEWKE